MPPPSRLCLSRDDSRGAPAPTLLLVSRQGGRDPLQIQVTTSTPYSYIGGVRQPGASPPPPPAQGRRAGIARATSCHRPSSPHHCAWRGLEAWGRGQCSEAVPALCVPNPAIPGLRASALRSLVPARRPPRSGARRAPARTLWHSQWRRGWSCKLGPVRAAGAQAGPDPEALPSERTTRK